MAFVTLDDWTIPVARGGEVMPQRIGSEQRAFSGRMVRDYRQTKRVWRYTTSLLAPEIANATVGFIEGQGHLWLGDWESTPFDDETMWSTKGLASNTSSGEAYGLRANVAADGNPIVDLAGYREGMYASNSALAVEPETANLLSDDASDCENSTTGYAAYNGGVISSESSIYAQGSKSIKVVAAAGNQGWTLTPAINISGASTYSALLYVYADSVVSWNLAIRSGAPTGNRGSVSFNTVSGSWVRVVLEAKSSVGGNTWLHTRFQTNVGNSGTCYTDAHQIVEDSYNHTWTLGQTTRSAGKLSYPTDITQDEFTYHAWVKVTTDSYGSVRNLAHLVSSTTSDAVRVYIDAAASTFSYELTDGDGNTSSAAITGSDFTDNDWHHICIRLKHDDSEGLRRIKAYWDGTEAIDSTTTYFPRITTLDSIYHGSNSSGALHLVDGIMDRVYLTPYAMAPAQISAIASATIAPGSTPQMRLGGLGAITDARYEVPVIGRVTGITIEPAWISGTYYNNAQRVAFELEQVQ